MCWGVPIVANRVPEKAIKNLQGKDFVLYWGLLELAHQDGLSATDTQILQFPCSENGNTTVVKATVTTKKGTFTGIGDASPASVPNKTIAVHSIRMAETRALARALRVATNVGMTAFEELGGHDEEPTQPKPAPGSPLARYQAAQITPAKEAIQPYQRPDQPTLNAISTAAKTINLLGEEFKGWLKDTHKTSWQRMSPEVASLVLADLQQLAADQAVEVTA